MHDVGDDYCGASRDTCITVDKDATRLHSLFDEVNCCLEMPHKVHIRHI